jgi:uncharacterized protein
MPLVDLIKINPARSVFGYKVADSMVKIIEEALSGEYTVTINSYASTMTAMDGIGEIGYTADVGMTQLYADEGAFRYYTFQ